MTTTDDDLEQRLRETLHTVGAATVPPDRLVERLHLAATSASVAAQTNSRDADLESPRQPPPSRRPAAARWAPLLAVAAVIAILAVGLGVAAVRHSPTPAPAASTSATAGSIASSRWSYLPAAPIQGRSNAVGAWTGTQMLVWGGAADRGQQQPLADGAAYDPATRAWSTLPAGPIAARTSAASVWTGRSLFIWGGYTSADAVVPADDGALYTPADHSWVTLPPSPVRGYQQVVALRSGEHVILLTTPRGGDGSVVNVQSYRPASNSWSRLPDLILPPGHSVEQVAAIAVDNQIHLWSLWSHVTTISPKATDSAYGIDAYTFDVPTHRWTANTLAGPSVKAVDGPLWTGQQILLPASQPYCGRCTGPLMFNRTGLMLNPTNSATSVIPHGPVDDLNPTYLWTGAALLAVNTRTSISGGPAGSASSSPGEAAVWDPHTTAWARLPDAPAGGAESPVTVWTGTSLLIWGQFAHDNGGTATNQHTAGLELGHGNEVDRAPPG